jgi:trigger factor
MEVIQNNTTDLTATITVKIAKEDYLSKFKEELGKLRRKAQIKGFRKGRVPESTLRKMYGEQVLAEAVNDSLQSAISNHIVDNDLNLLGQPIPLETEDDRIIFDATNLQDYSFDFEIGMAPPLTDISGAGESDSYTLLKVDVADTEVQEEIDNAAKRLGDRIEEDKDIIENDIIQIKAVELDADGKVLDKGHETGFSVMVDLLTDDIKAEVLKLKNGDSFDFDIYKIEKDRTDDYVKKYLLNLDPEEDKEIGNQFKGEIEKVTRLVPAEMGQDFFDKYFGPGVVSSEEEAREKIRTSISGYYDEQCRSLMFRDIMDRLMEENKFDVPKDFLTKWMVFNGQEVPSDEDFDKSVDNLRWSLIAGALAKKFDVKVESEHIQRHFANQAMQYMGQYGGDPSLVQGIVQQMMQNQEQVNKAYEEVRAEMVFDKVAETVTKVEDTISAEDFRAKVKAVNEKVNN